MRLVYGELSRAWNNRRIWVEQCLGSRAALSARVDCVFRRGCLRLGCLEGARLSPEEGLVAHRRSQLVISEEVLGADLCNINVLHREEDVIRLEVGDALLLAESRDEFLLPPDEVRLMLSDHLLDQLVVILLLIFFGELGVLFLDPAHRKLRL